MLVSDAWLATSVSPVYHDATSSILRAMAQPTDPTPEAYEVGFVPFLGATIYLDSRPLIPRTETEFWVEQAITSLRARQNPLQIADIFAGSGCAGIAALLHLKNAEVTFLELEERHLSTIWKSIRANGIDERRATVLKSDVWSAATHSFNVVFANPPYLSRSRLARVETSVLLYEPQEALFAPDDGYALIAATIQGLPTFLAPGGVCYIEHEPEHADRIRASATLLGLSATHEKDQYGVLRYSVILKP